jgi:hypothetical protein
MDNQNMARVLQNMIDEAEEHLTRLALESMGAETKASIDKRLAPRRADLAEAVKLVEELGQPAPAEQGEGLEIGWMIEKRCGPPEWYTGNGWSTDAGEGLRFARKADAEIILKKEKLHYCSVPVEATEHAWDLGAYLPASRPQPEAAKDVRELDLLGVGDSDIAIISREVNWLAHYSRYPTEGPVREIRDALARLASAREQGECKVSVKDCPKCVKVYGWLDQANFRKNEYLARAEKAEADCRKAMEASQEEVNALVARAELAERKGESGEYGFIEPSGSAWELANWAKYGRQDETGTIHILSRDELAVTIETYARSRIEISKKEKP